MSMPNMLHFCKVSLEKLLCSGENRCNQFRPFPILRDRHGTAPAKNAIVLALIAEIMAFRQALNPQLDESPAQAYSHFRKANKWRK
jgi:hypothetical protein